MCKIGIIGGGSAAVAILAQLVPMLNKNNITAEIYIYEKNQANKIGFGLAYSTQRPEHILNLPSKAMSIYPETPNHFIDWAQNNKDKWLSIFPDLDLEIELFPPRYLFGLYLESELENIRNTAERHSVKIECIYQEVINLESNGDKFNLTLKDSDESMLFNQIFLCTGHLPSSNYTDLIGTPGYLHSPWDSEASGIELIPKEAPVVILGTRLTAIDTALSLVANDHKGQILMVSRNGLLPTVIGNTQYYAKRHLTGEVIDDITANGTAKIGLERVIELFWQEIETAEGKLFTPNAREKLIKPELASIAWLKNQISGAKGTVRPWQAVLASLYPLVPKLWNALKQEDKKTFIKDYYSIWLTYLGAFPLSNAEQMLKLMNQQKLSIIGGLSSVSFDSISQKFILDCADTDYSTSYLINCTGSGHDYNLAKPELFQNLLNQNLICTHPLGGIKVDFQTLLALNKDKKKIENFYVIGDATWGTCMATADFNQVLNEAKRSCNTAIRSLRATQKNYSTAIKNHGLINELQHRDESRLSGNSFSSDSSSSSSSSSSSTDTDQSIRISNC